MAQHNNGCPACEKYNRQVQELKKKISKLKADIAMKNICIKGLKELIEN